jgi:hypothetical protein
MSGALVDDIHKFLLLWAPAVLNQDEVEYGQENV